MNFNKKIFYITSFFALVAFSKSFAQQEVQISQYMFNTMSYNPAFAGFSRAISASGIFRQQWVGFTEEVNGEKEKVAPQTTLVTVDAPIRFVHGGVGLTLINDKYAHFTDAGLRLSYSYHMDLGGPRLGMGLHVGFVDKSIGISKLVFPDVPEDPIKNSATDDINAFNYDFAIGGYYEVPDLYNISLSITNLNGYKSKDLPYKNKQNLYLSGSYIFPFPEIDIDLTPSVMFKTDFTALQSEYSCIATYKKQFWGGLSYRFRDAVVILAGLNIKQISVGVAYDIETNMLRHSSPVGGGFEIFARYNFRIETDKIAKSYKNSRYL